MYRQFRLISSTDALSYALVAPLTKTLWRGASRERIQANARDMSTRAGEVPWPAKARRRWCSSMTPRFVYNHQAELGAIRLSTGPMARPVAHDFSRPVRGAGDHGQAAGILSMRASPNASATEGPERGGTPLLATPRS